MAFEWWRCCRQVQAGFPSCNRRYGEAGVCEEFGEYTHSPGVSCLGVDCDGWLQTTEASCCIENPNNVPGEPPDCETMSIWDCWEVPFGRGTPELPAGCGEEISCVGEVQGACCTDGECTAVTRAECTEGGGDVFHEGKTCAQVLCQVVLIETGCRTTRRARPGSYYTGYDPGDKAHSLDLCETVVMASIHHQSSGGADLGGDVQPGYVTPVTAHEVRAKWVSVNQDPCRFCAGRWAKGPDGYVRPCLYSQLKENPSSARLNVGFAFKQQGEDRQGRLRAGYVGGLVGVEPPRWNEVVFRFNPALCGRPIE